MKIIVNGVHINVTQVAKLKSIEELKALEIFSTNADAANQAVWDKAMEFKAKQAEPKVEEPAKVKVTKEKEHPVKK